jgi:ribosomal protein S18 acetylase RimI-like enzyme
LKSSCAQCNQLSFPDVKGFAACRFPFSASESRTGSMITAVGGGSRAGVSAAIPSSIPDRRFAFSEMPSTSLVDPKEAVPVDSSRSSTLETWLVTVDEVIVGIMALHDTDIDQLYLDPQWRGRGIGDLLIAHAKSQRPEGLGLWTFQVNIPACRFYELHGFVEVTRTDGSRNEEHEPDIRLQWTPPAGD